MVSLFPPTYANRANGNRKDIMERLAAMHPAFL
jgi:alpha-N-arabinofuranosidase